MARVKVSIVFESGARIGAGIRYASLNPASRRATTRCRTAEDSRCCRSKSSSITRQGASLVPPAVCNQPTLLCSFLMPSTNEVIGVGPVMRRP